MTSPSLLRSGCWRRHSASAAKSLISAFHCSVDVPFHQPLGMRVGGSRALDATAESSFSLRQHTHFAPSPLSTLPDLLPGSRPAHLTGTSMASHGLLRSLSRLPVPSRCVQRALLQCRLSLLHFNPLQPPVVLGAEPKLPTAVSHPRLLVIWCLLTCPVSSPSKFPFSTPRPLPFSSTTLYFSRSNTPNPTIILKYSHFSHTVFSFALPLALGKYTLTFLLPSHYPRLSNHYLSLGLKLRHHLL